MTLRGTSRLKPLLRRIVLIHPRKPLQINYFAGVSLASQALLTYSLLLLLPLLLSWSLFLALRSLLFLMEFSLSMMDVARITTASQVWVSRTLSTLLGTAPALPGTADNEREHVLRLHHFQGIPDTPRFGIRRFDVGSCQSIRARKYLVLSVNFLILRNHNKIKL